MELQYFGADSLQIVTKKSVTVVDPSSDITTIKPDLKKATLVLATQSTLLPDLAKDVFAIDSPGEYEFADCSIKGVAAQAHIAASGNKDITMYRFTAGDVVMLVTGHINAQLSETQLEEIGMIDVLVLPVGGGGYTLDAVGAATVVRAIEPKVVIPVHYGDDGLTYEVPQQKLEEFTKELSAPVAEPLDKYKIKVLPELLTVQPLNRQS